MMSNRLLLTMAILGTLVGARFSQAVTIGLSSPDDLTMLSPGDTATVNLEILDLGGFVEINTILAEMLIPSDIFAAPSITDITPGPAVPDLTGFAPTLFAAPPPDAHVAGGFYDDLLGVLPPITLTDVFYSVQLQVIGTGTGAIGVEPLTSFAVGTDATGNPQTLGPPLPVGVRALPVVSTPVIPEPVTAGLSMLGLGALALAVRRRCEA